jgi:hypothetical protein
MVRVKVVNDRLLAAWRRTMGSADPFPDVSPVVFEVYVDIHSEFNGSWQGMISLHQDNSVQDELQAYTVVVARMRERAKDLGPRR